MSQCNIALVQYDPQFKQVKQNMAHVEKMIGHLTPELVDILLLPEMAFTGYMFSSLKEITPFLEDEVGPSITWAKKTAARLRCIVLVGYPERASSGQAFNSVAIVDYKGQLQTIYRKHFLYDTDKSWACEGPAFRTIEIKWKDDMEPARVAPGICMDLNPKDFVAPFEAFEFANHAKNDCVQLVLCCMNWLMSEPSLDAEDGSTADLAQASDSWDSVKQTLSYFALRMTPLIGSNVVFVGCNRSGVERGTAFTGSSCVMQLGARPIVLDYADQTEEKVVVAPVTIPMRKA